MKATRDPQLEGPVCQASFVRYGSGKGKELFLFSNPASSSDRHQMTIKASLDKYVTGTTGIIHKGPAAYSCLTVLPNGKIGLIYEAGDKDPYERMEFVSVDPDELFNSILYREKTDLFNFHPSACKPAGSLSEKSINSSPILCMFKSCLITASPIKFNFYEAPLFSDSRIAVYYLQLRH